MACRKNFLDLDNDERDLLANALNNIFANGMIAMFADHHGTHFNHGIHRGPAFLPWHRYFLLTVEEEMRKFDSRAILPFWEWTNPNSQDLNQEPWLSFFGGRSGRGRFSNWSFTRAANPQGPYPNLDSVISELRANSFANFRAMEFGSHVSPHTSTGGTMEGIRSPEDPLFYLHHCNVDRLWAIWQRNHAGVDQYTLDDCGGCLRIDETFVPLNSPMIGGATPTSMLDHVALGYTYPEDDRLQQRVLALGFPAMVTEDPPQIDLLTPTVNFNDVPEGDTTRRTATFQVSCCGHLTFTVSPGPGAPFSLMDPGPFSFPPGPLPQSELRIWVLFTGQAANTTAPPSSMTVTVHDEFGVEAHAPFVIPVIANSVRRPRAGVVLVLDASGSMLAQAGNGRTRVQVLRQAATTFVDHMYDDNGLAIVSFADAATKVTDLQVAGGMASAVRTEARNKIAVHGPPDEFPHTGIGGGVQKAGEIYATSPIAPDFDVQSTIVFTDGIEDRHPFVSEVTVGERVYAIGVADAANVQSDVLRQLANNTGGFMLVTGEVPPDDEFLLEKFFIQVLAGVANRFMVRDPEGTVIPGEIARVPFHLTRSDIAFDALTLSRLPQFLALALQTPDGTIVNRFQVPADGFRAADTSQGFRLTLPLVVNGVEHWGGEWQLLLGVAGRSVSHATFSRTFTNAAAVLRFHALMHVRSNLAMRASIDQSAPTPGATLFVRAVITEYGEPIETGPMVVAQMTRPDHTTGAITLTEIDSGQFEVSTVATQSGVYRFLIQARGRTTRGEVFTREQLVTAVVGYPSHGTTGGGQTGEGPGKGLDFCDLVHCLFDQGVMTDRFVRMLEEKGIDIGRFRKCLDKACRDEPPPVLR